MCCSRTGAKEASSSTEARFDAAARAYHARQFSIAVSLSDAIAAHTTDPRVHYLRGRAFKALGDLDQAESSYRAAVGLDAGYADAWVSLGIVLRAKGQLEAAMACYSAALARDDRAVEAWINLGNARLELRRFEEAENAYRAAAAVQPRNTLARVRLGLSLRYQRNLEGAAEAFDAVLAETPDHPEAHVQRGLVFEQQGRLADAMAHYERALLQEPARPGALYRKAFLLRAQGEAAAADEALAAAIKALPADPDANLELGNQLLFQDRYWEAAACFRRLLEVRPRDALALSNLGQCQRQMGELEAAKATFTRAIELEPEFAMPYQGLGAVEVRLGGVAKAIDAFRRACELDPEFVEAYSSELLTLNYLGDVMPAELHAAHERFGDRFSTTSEADQIVELVESRRKRPDPQRIRVGYVSPDFRRHSVAYFIEPLLERHDRARFEVYCYYESATNDPVTERLRALADRWRQVAGDPADTTGKLVTADGIDILVDLAGHAGRAPRLFCHRWAPLQVTYLGYPTTTGLHTIDYRVTDSWVDPDGYEAFNVERPLRLPGSYFCYRPPPLDVPASHLDQTSADVVFGCFNNLAKISQPTLRLWRAVLEAVPRARLFLKNVGLQEPESRRDLLRDLGDAGIDSKRVELANWHPAPRDHLGAYRRVDLALDTWPYNGATTTCEALWMGVPVVSRTGATHASRMGLSILSAAGMAELAADSDDLFVEICVGLAQNVRSLRARRESQRTRLQQSRLLDEAVFVHDFEALLQQAWETCAPETVA